MLTVFFVGILFALFVGLATEDDAATVAAFLLGTLIGFLLAVLFGVGVPTQTTVLVSQPLVQLPVGQDKEQVFYLEESGDRYLFQTSNEIVSFPKSEAEIDIDLGIEPRVDYVRYDLPEDQEWKLLWVIVSGSSGNGIIIHVPQGTVYIVSNK